MIINEKDNVGVCLDGNGTVPAGHKYALRSIGAGEYVVKYGEVIGRATRDIAEGEWVHTHNLKSHLDESVDLFLPRKRPREKKIYLSRL